MKFQDGDSERGNVTAEFVMVSVLVMMLFAVVLQIAFALYAKNIMIDAASAGSRYGTLLDRSEADGRARTQEILAGTLPDVYETSVSSSVVNVNGVQALEIRVKGTLPVVGPFGFDQGIEVTGHAIVQK